ncbi:DEKNAAC104042 [Brettanomyces naardenensis]|uniref:DEKNAAC104042 n=1 Tax=Brettanomyces naardenensis TaxID=13370 RepID=A0A448YQK2_BRENA|nr:DEKNAAC104042 [Brettanomyces naardenensis]
MPFTTTLATTIVPDFQILLTVPTNSDAHTIPITLHVSKEGANTKLGAYVYSIVDTRRSERTVYQSLLNNSDEESVDLAKKLGTLVSRRYSVPSYVSVSGEVGIEEYLPMSREVIRVIEEQGMS